MDNGVKLPMAVDDDEKQKHAEAIRAQLDELYGKRRRVEEDIAEGEAHNRRVDAQKAASGCSVVLAVAGVLASAFWVTVLWA